MVELLVALTILGVLMGGMAKVFTASLSSFGRASEMISAQRALRTTVDMISDDIQMIGYAFPPMNMRGVTVAASNLTTVQSGLMLIPGQPIKKLSGTAFADRLATEDPFEPTTKTVDELSFVMDVPLTGACNLSFGTAIKSLTPTVTDNTIETSNPALSNLVWVTADQATSLHAGDLLMVLDTHFEFAKVVADMSLPAKQATQVTVTPYNNAASGSASFNFLHVGGAQVAFVRPLRVVRYAVVYLALEDAGNPDNPGGLVPCLVRFETGYPSTQATPNWAGLLTRPATLEGTATIIAQNVTGFTVDLSFNGAFPGVRGATWATTVANINTAVNTIYGKAGAATNAMDPLWFRNYPATLSMQIETRNALPRTEYIDPTRSTTLQRQFLYRTQTLMLTPRNFGLDRSL
jgi:type II secretory pathway pseudopilin PulG